MTSATPTPDSPRARIARDAARTMRSWVSSFRLDDCMMAIILPDWRMSSDGSGLAIPVQQVLQVLLPAARRPLVDIALRRMRGHLLQRQLAGQHRFAEGRLPAGVALLDEV